MKKYSTSRLELVPFTEEFSEFLLELYNIPTFIKYIGDRNLRTLDDAKAYIQNRFLPQFEKLGFGNYVVILKENNKPIGGVGIFEREGLEVLDIGFSFLEEYEGKGYAFEAASELMKKIEEDFGLTKVSAMTTEDNFSSQKLIQKLGLKYQKKIKPFTDDEELLYFEN